MKRLGGTDERERAKWLVETFVYEDPDELSSGRRLDRRQELAALVLLSMIGKTAAPTITEARVRLGAAGELADAAALRTAWRNISECIQRWAKGEPITLPSITTTVELRPETPTGKDLRARIMRVGEGLGTTALYAVFDLLAHPDVRLRVCSVCKKLFVPNRRQERHPKCARQLRDSKRPERGKKAKKGRTP